jgi:uncharacterized protein (DUF924 family)
MQRRAHEVLEFWFGLRPYSLPQVQQRSRLWFGDPAHPELLPQYDEFLTQRFGALVADAAAGRLAAWESSPRRRLALILLLDQLPRNVHRGKPEAFVQDRAALSLTVSGMQLGAEAALDPVERVFFYMPLQHAESAEIQEESVAAFQRLATEGPAELKPFFEEVLRHAHEHRGWIERFGRFPLRNAALGRASTRDEQQWLASLVPARPAATMPPVASGPPG